MRKPVRPKAPSPVKVDTKRDEVKGQENSTTKPKGSTNYRYGDINSVHCTIVVIVLEIGVLLPTCTCVYATVGEGMAFLSDPSQNAVSLRQPYLFLPTPLSHPSSNVSFSPPPSLSLSFPPGQAPATHCLGREGGSYEGRGR